MPPEDCTQTLGSMTDSDSDLVRVILEMMQDEEIALVDENARAPELESDADSGGTKDIPDEQDMMQQHENDTTGSEEKADLSLARDKETTPVPTKRRRHKRRKILPPGQLRIENFFVRIPSNI